MSGPYAFAIVSALLVFTLGFLPVVHHLFYGLNERRREILSYFDKQSINLYFTQFYQAEASQPSNDPTKAFADLYTQRFGPRTFLLAVVLYAVSLALVVWTVTFSALTIDFFSVPKLEIRGVYALAGAYLWVIWDLVTRFRQRDIVPSVLYWHT